MIYAIIEASGKQIWIQPGCFYDINKIDAKPGEIIKLEKTLLINNNTKVFIGSNNDILYVKNNVLFSIEKNEIFRFSENCIGAIKYKSNIIFLNESNNIIFSV